MISPILHWRFGQAGNAVTELKLEFMVAFQNLANTAHCQMHGNWDVWIKACGFSEGDSETSMAWSGNTSRASTYINVELPNSEAPFCIGIILNTSGEGVQGFKLVVFLTVFDLSTSKEMQQLTDSNKSAVVLVQNSSLLSKKVETNKWRKALKQDFSFVFCLKWQRKHSITIRL